jgi:hypothetical protein
MRATVIIAAAFMLLATPAFAETTVLQEYYSGNQNKFDKQVDKIFSMLDINDDSVLDGTELQASWETMKNDSSLSKSLIPLNQVTVTQFSQAKELLGAELAKFDTSHDGNISREEFHIGMAPVMNMTVPSKTELCDKTKVIVKQCREKPGVNKISELNRGFFGGLCRSGISMARGYLLESCVINNADDCNKVAECYNKDFRIAEASNSLQKRDDYPKQLRVKDAIFAIFFFLGILFAFFSPISIAIGFVYYMILGVAFYIDHIVRVGVYRQNQWSQMLNASKQQQKID